MALRLSRVKVARRRASETVFWGAELRENGAISCEALDLGVRSMGYIQTGAALAHLDWEPVNPVHDAVSQLGRILG